MLRSAAIVSWALLGLTACGSSPPSTTGSQPPNPPPTQDANRNSLFPAHSGDSWTYASTTNVPGAQRHSTTVAITSVTPISGGRRAVVQRTSDESGAPVTSTGHYDLMDDGSVLMDLASFAPDSTRGSVNGQLGVIIPSQADIRTHLPRTATADVTTPPGQVQVHLHYEATTTLIDTSPVAAPAGTFQAIHLHVAATFVPGPVEGIVAHPISISIEFFLAAGVGLVRMQMVSSTQIATLELTSFAVH